MEKLKNMDQTFKTIDFIRVNFRLKIILDKIVNEP
jgi:hypothetical protein